MPTRDEIVEVMARAAVESRPIPEGCVRGDVNWDYFRSLAAASLSALEAAGLRVVPQVPSVAMLMAAGRYTDHCAVHNYGGCPDTEGTWDAMLAASQEDGK